MLQSPQVTSSSEKLVYSVVEAAAAISMSRAFVFEVLAAGKLKSFKIGSRRLIHAEDLSSFINSYRNGAETEDQP